MPATAHNDNPSPDEWEAVRQAAREGCYDWYLAALLAPRAARADLITLAAFAGEIGRIPSLVSEPMMGAVRLQWWRDALAVAPDRRTGNPLADNLRRLVARLPGAEADIIAVIDALEVELQPDPPADAHALTVHLDKHWGSLLRLSARALDDGPSPLPLPVARDAARAYGFALLACELASGRRRGQTLVPQDIRSRAGCSLEDLRNDAGGAAARRVHAEFVHEAEDTLTICRHHLAALPRRLAPALWPLAVVAPYLNAARARNAQPPSELVKAWRMLRTWATGRV